jgi:hypothetical protein
MREERGMTYESIRIAPGSPPSRNDGKNFPGGWKKLELLHRMNEFASRFAAVLG